MLLVPVFGAGSSCCRVSADYEDGGRVVFGGAVRGGESSLSQLGCRRMWLPILWATRRRHCFDNTNPKNIRIFQDPD